jgi:tetratricopeptide (TPR) repeat protein
LKNRLRSKILEVRNNNKIYGMICQFERSREHIKRLLFVFLFLFSFVSFYANDLQSKAEKAYSEKKYKEAITAYQDILKEGAVSYKLYYNLGNAYYKNNELGKAIYNYELANKLQPNNEDVKTNLRIVNEKTLDDIESKENFFLGALKSGLVNSLTTTGWAWLSIGSLIGCFALALLFFISKNMVLKRLGFFVSIICLISFIGSMVLGYTALNNKQQIKFAIITIRETKIHEEPNTASESKFSLHEGTKVKVLETNIDWTNIKLENGNEGWVKTTDVGLF